VSSKKADVKGAALASYLLFESGYTRELMALGYADAMNKKGDICSFFGWTDPGEAALGPDDPAFCKVFVDRRRDPLRLR